MKAIVFLLGLAAILAISMLAAANNQQEVQIVYFVGKSWSGRLWVAILAAFGMGALLAGLSAGALLAMEKLKNGTLSRKLARLEEELKMVKQRPMPDEPAALARAGARPEV